MLVLSRGGGEQIVIGRDIVVTVIKCGGNVVRLGITAPREIPIRREELIGPVQDRARQPTGMRQPEGARSAGT